MSDKEFVLIGRCQSKTRDYIKHLERQNTKANEEIERLANIIKEAREYIEHNYYKDIAKGNGTLRETILQILDKENK